MVPGYKPYQDHIEGKCDRCKQTMRERDALEIDDANEEQGPCYKKIHRTCLLRTDEINYDPREARMVQRRPR